LVNPTLRRLSGSEPKAAGAAVIYLDESGFGLSLPPARGKAGVRCVPRAWGKWGADGNHRVSTGLAREAEGDGKPVVRRFTGLADF